MRTRRCLVTVLSALAVTVGLAVTPASGAEDKPISEDFPPIEDPVPAGFRDWAEVFDMQNKLNAAADRITDARATGTDDGYTGIVADPRNRELKVFWRGPVPAKVAQAIDDVKRDVPVAQAAGRYSEQEMLDEGRRIATGRGVSGAAPNVDGSGLTVSVTGSESEGRQIPEVRGATVPVAIVPFTVVELAANKQNDSSPYWGSAVFITPNHACSTGFAVRQENETRMLTSGHCGTDKDIAKDGGHDVMGPIVGWNPVRDTMIIRTRSAGRVYVGDWMSSSSLPVHGASGVKVGNVVCSDGAFTRTHCPLWVEKVNQFAQVSTGMIVFPMVKTLTGPISMGLGDSGGPVFDFFEYGAHKSITAMGTISAGANPVGPCDNSPRCFRTLYFADINKTMINYASAGFAMSIVTSP